jgi:tRNA-binding protein
LRSYCRPAIEIEDLPETRKAAYKLKMDFGPEIGVRKSSAQLNELWDREIVNSKPLLWSPSRYSSVVS